MHIHPNPALVIEQIALADLVPAARSARRHPKAQIEALAAAIRRFGFAVPLLVDSQTRIIAGHARLEAARRLGLVRVPAVRLEHLSPGEARALALADNKLPELACWDAKVLAEELAELVAIDVSLEGVGFEAPDIDRILIAGKACAAPAAGGEEAMLAVDQSAAPVTRPGDLWLMGEHRLLCGDARDPAVFATLLDEKRAAMVICDPPYNVPITGHVKTSAGFREFPMANGEMDSAQFTAFLGRICANLARFSNPGALIFEFMDWRHLRELLEAGAAAQLTLINLCVWVKPSPGMGSLYRSQHELVVVFRAPGGRHQNNVQLGRFGRNRSNVWMYPGRPSADDADARQHPMPKPQALVVDAVLDCTKRRDLVLDCFAGSGTIILAAEEAGRCAAAIEVDAHYCDLAIVRWQRMTGGSALHADSQESFASLAARRAAQADEALRTGSDER